jgi:hypothetical protein
MTYGGQARLTGPVGPISLALLIVGGGSACWYVANVRNGIQFLFLEMNSFIMPNQVLPAERETAAGGDLIAVCCGFLFASQLFIGQSHT